MLPYFVLRAPPTPCGRWGKYENLVRAAPLTTGRSVSTTGLKRRVSISFVHSWIPLNTTELGLPSQSDPLVRGSLNIRAICRLAVYLYTSLFCPVPRPVFRPPCVARAFVSFRLSCFVFAYSCHHVWRRKDELNVDPWIMLFYWKAY